MISTSKITINRNGFSYGAEPDRLTVGALGVGSFFVRPGDLAAGRIFFIDERNLRHYEPSEIVAVCVAGPGSEKGRTLAMGKSLEVARIDLTIVVNHLTTSHPSTEIDDDSDE